MLRQTTSRHLSATIKASTTGLFFSSHFEFSKAIANPKKEWNHLQGLSCNATLGRQLYGDPTASPLANPRQRVGSKPVRAEPQAAVLGDAGI
jgi:hypothetical protein